MEKFLRDDSVYTVKEQENLRILHGSTDTNNQKKLLYSFSNAKERQKVWSS